MKNLIFGVTAIFALFLTSCKKSETAMPVNTEIASATNEQPKVGDIVPNEKVCMVNDRFMGVKQIPIDVDGTTYFGCCEGCVEKFNAENYQLWANGQRYGRSMIHDFNNGTVGWTDWNILLDQNGGPNHVGNFCFAPIHGDIATGELIYTPSYYFIGHFSKFIKPGAKNITNSVSRSQLIATTFQNPNGEFVTVVMNESDKEITYFLNSNNQASELKIPAKAIQTLVY